MIFYYGTYILMLILLFKNKNKNNVKLLDIFMIVFFILSFIRWEVGTDWEPYYNNFISNNSFDEFYNAIHFDKGFQFLNFISKKIYNSYNFCLFIQSLLIYICMYKSIKKNSDNYLVTIIFFYCSYLGNVFFVRQNIAIALSVYAIKYIEENKILKFYLLILLASSIHISAIVFLPAYVIYSIKLKNHELYLTFFLLVVIIILIGKPLVKSVFEIISPYRLIYFENISASTREKNSVILTAILSRLFFIIYYMIVFWKKRIENLKTNGFINFYLFSCVIYFMAISINPDLGRLALYYEIVNLYLCTEFFKIQKDKIWKIFFMIFLILYLFIRLRTNVYSFYEMFVPYKSILWGR